MKRILVHTSLFAFLGVQPMLADFSYEQKSQITGGMMTKLAFMSKQIREPQVSAVMLKGNRMAHVSEGRISVIDAGKETITDINLKDKTYSVMTFAQMKQMMEEAQKKMGQKADVSVSVDVKETGETQTIQGMNCKEFVLTMKMTTTDAKSGKSADMVMVSHNWVTKDVPGISETREFHMKMGQKLGSYMPGGGMSMMNRPDMQQGMAKMYESAMKMNGMTILQTTGMSMAGEAGDAMRQARQAQADGQAQAAQQQQSQPRPSAESAAAEAIAGRLGRLGGIGGIGRKKKETPPADAPPVVQAAPVAAPAAGGDDSGSMMEMRIDHTNFSTSPVDASKFEIPAGVKQVERKR